MPDASDSELENLFEGGSPGLIETAEAVTSRAIELYATQDFPEESRRFEHAHATASRYDPQNLDEAAAIMMFMRRHFAVSRASVELVGEWMGVRGGTDLAADAALLAEVWDRELIEADYLAARQWMIDECFVLIEDGDVTTAVADDETRSMLKRMRSAGAPVELSPYGYFEDIERNIDELSDDELRGALHDVALEQLRGIDADLAEYGDDEWSPYMKTNRERWLACAKATA